MTDLQRPGRARSTHIRRRRSAAALLLLAAGVGAACGAGAGTSAGGSQPAASQPAASQPATPAAAVPCPAGAPDPQRSLPPLAAPAATPLPEPPSEPASDGTRVRIPTSEGEIVIEVFTESSPVAAANFVQLAESGFYDCVVFHRVVPGFVIQGGDPEGTGTGGPGYTIEDEAVVGDYLRGIVAMARTQMPDSQGSQFFIVLDDSVAERLDEAGGYAILGRVVEGMETVDAIAAMPVGGPRGDEALEPVQMLDVTVERP